jgi:hypothetical protein
VSAVNSGRQAKKLNESGASDVVQSMLTMRVCERLSPRVDNAHAVVVAHAACSLGFRARVEVARAL